MFYVPEMEMTELEGEWDMTYDGGIQYIDPEALEEARKKIVTKDRNCPTCHVGWKVDQDGDNCWSCDAYGDVGVAK